MSQCSLIGKWYRQYPLQVASSPAVGRPSQEIARVDWSSLKFHSGSHLPSQEIFGVISDVNWSKHILVGVCADAMTLQLLARTDVARVQVDPDIVEEECSCSSRDIVIGWAECIGRVSPGVS